MHETFTVAWRGSAEALHRDGFGQEFECQVAVTSDGRVMASGVDEVLRSAPLHDGWFHPRSLCIAGVPRPGVAPALVCAVAAEIRRQAGHT